MASFLFSRAQMTNGKPNLSRYSRLYSLEERDLFLRQELPGPPRPARRADCSGAGPPSRASLPDQVGMRARSGRSSLPQPLPRTVDTSSRWSAASERERPRCPGSLRDPGGALEERPADADEPSQVTVVQLRKRDGPAAHELKRLATIRAARAMSSIRLNSAGLWLIPSLLATKSMAAGRKGARMAVSCRAPLAASGNRRSEPPRARRGAGVRRLRRPAGRPATPPCSKISMSNPRPRAIAGAVLRSRSLIPAGEGRVGSGRGSRC